MTTPPSSSKGSSRAALSYAPGQARGVSRRRVLRGLLYACAAGVVAGAYRYLARDRNVASVSVAPMAAPPPPTTRPAGADVEQVYRESMLPLLNGFNTRNLAAAQRASATLHERIAGHRRGIKPFTHEITSWATRFGVIGRYSEDLWNRMRGRPQDVAHVRAYVDEKFRRHILSEVSLRADVTAVLMQFDEDMTASRNRLYAELSLPLIRIRAALPSHDLTVERFRQNVDDRALAITRALPSDTVVAGLAALAGGWAATDASQAITTRIVAQLLAQLGTAMAAEGIEAGGATVGGAVAGGGTGTLGGPAGTIIGVGVGLIVGAVVDWWLSDKFEQKVADQCTHFLDTLEQRLRDGAPGSPGLWSTLVDTVNLTARTQQKAIHDAVRQETQ